MTFAQNSYFNWSKYSMRSYFDICIPANPSFLARSAALDAAQLVALQSGCCTAVHPPAARPSARAAEPVAQRWQETCASRQKKHFRPFRFSSTSVQVPRARVLAHLPASLAIFENSVRATARCRRPFQNFSTKTRRHRRAQACARGTRDLKFILGAASPP